MDFVQLSMFLRFIQDFTQSLQTKTTENPVYLFTVVKQETYLVYLRLLVDVFISQVKK